MPKKWCLWVLSMQLIHPHWDSAYFQNQANRWDHSASQQSGRSRRHCLLTKCPFGIHSFVPHLWVSLKKWALRNNQEDYHPTKKAHCVLGPVVLPQLKWTKSFQSNGQLQLARIWPAAQIAKCSLYLADGRSPKVLTQLLVAQCSLIRNWQVWIWKAEVWNYFCGPAVLCR